MSITDELRGWWVRKFPVMDKELHEDFTAIANRIDAEHQKAIRELNNLADASVLLPVDADGVPIRVGDMMEYGKARGHVIALMLSKYPKKWGGELHWGVQLEGEQAPTALDLTFRHYHAPTVEDVMVEFAADWECAQDGEDKTAVLKEYAKRFKLAEGED